MNTSTSVQLSRFKEPQIETSKVTEGHSVPEEVLFECSFLIIESVLLFFEMLFNKPFSIIVEMLKNEGFI